MLDATLAANQQQIDRAIGMIARNGKRRVAMLGLTFKPDTDDLRESPLVELAERLIGKGFEVVIYDRDLQLSRLVGSNRRFAMQHLPHLSGLLVGDLDDALERSDIVVVGTPHASFRRSAAAAQRPTIKSSILPGTTSTLRGIPAMRESAGDGQDRLKSSLGIWRWRALALQRLKISCALRLSAA